MKQLENSQIMRYNFSGSIKGAPLTLVLPLFFNFFYGFRKQALSQSA